MPRYVHGSRSYVSHPGDAWYGVPAKHAHRSHVAVQQKYCVGVKEVLPHLAWPQVSAMFTLYRVLDSTGFCKCLQLAPLLRRRSPRRW